jgi:hypothetical protein
MLLAFAGIVTLLSGCSAAPRVLPSSSSNGVIRGTLEACGHGPSPTVTLHDKDGQVVATAVWHRPTSSGGTNERTLDFSFTVRPGRYYLTMNNEFQMPPTARQIDLPTDQVFTTHIAACRPSPSRPTEPSTPRSAGESQPGISSSSSRRTGGGWWSKAGDSSTGSPSRDEPPALVRGARQCPRAPRSLAVVDRRADSWRRTSSCAEGSP